MSFYLAYRNSERNHNSKLRIKQKISLENIEIEKKKVKMRERK